MNRVAAAKEAAEKPFQASGRSKPLGRWAMLATAIVMPIYAGTATRPCAAADPPVFKTPHSSTAPRLPLASAAPLPMKPLPAPPPQAGEPRVVLARGAAYARLGDYSRAIESYSLLLKNRPTDADVLLANAQAFLGRAKAAEQAKEANTTLLTHPQDVPARLHRAFAYYNMGEYNKAASDYDALLDANPDYVAAYLGRALVHVATEAWGDAAADYRRAFLLRPDLMPTVGEPSSLHLLVEQE